MKTTTNLPFLYWGGDPIRVLHQSARFPAACRPVFRQWEKFLSALRAGTGKFESFVRAGHPVWLDVPFNGGEARLFIAPFYVDEQGVRPRWHFLVVATGPADVPTNADYVDCLLALSPVTRAEIERVTTEGADFLLTIAPTDPLVGDRGRTQSGAASVSITGTLAERLAVLRGKLLPPPQTTTRPECLACNPPTSHPLFTRLLLSDDFPLPGLTVSDNAPLEEHGIGPQHPPASPAFGSPRIEDRPTLSIVAKPAWHNLQKWPLPLLLAASLTANAILWSKLNDVEQSRDEWKHKAQDSPLKQAEFNARIDSLERKIDKLQQSVAAIPTDIKQRKPNLPESRSD